MWFLIIATLVVAVLLFIFFSRSKESYWKKYGIKEIDTSVACSKLDIMLGKKGAVEQDDYTYKVLGQDKFCGVIDMGKPMIFLKDLDLIKKVLIKDFNYFVDRRQFFSDADKSMKNMMISLQGDEWKGVRSSVSPTFTTGKIRRMMDYFNSVGHEWVEHLTSGANQNENNGSLIIDVLKTVNSYTVDVISSSVFGLESGAIKNQDSKFFKMALRMTDFNAKQLLKFALMFMFPKIFKLLKIKLMDPEVNSFFGGILDEGLKARMRGEVKRNDFLQLLVEAKRGELKGVGNDELNSFEKEAEIKAVDKKQYLTEDIMSAQCLLFFLAGFGTTSSLISFTIYFLAEHHDVQEKLRKEVESVVEADGSFDYDKIGQLTYMDMVISEILRKFPGSNRLERVCIKDYKDPETGLVVPKGTSVIIPVTGIHNDQQYYDNPEKFDPEHFSPEKKAKRSPYAYMPFGHGPRNCIGMRFALIESKTGIAHIVHNFMIEPTPKTPLPAKGRLAGLVFLPPKNLELKLTPIRR